MMPSGQSKLKLRDIKRLRVVRLGEAEASLSDLVREAQRLARHSEHQFRLANKLLESELGLDKLTFQKPAGHTALFSDIMANGRFDGDYFQPQYHAIRSLIENYYGGSEPLLTGCDSLKPNIDPSTRPKKLFNYIGLSNVN
ncbi:hypothetical protein [uncultured Thiodictyon sp.]|uniref:hypothetical protein n=1 Tax=uncultured Thiodictyon sp. TaxID=1846217 RepID=UPI002600FFCE|nr:hypothetical protein [uncultured Thiodictyon sp.]